MPNLISEEVTRFIVTYIDSIAELETLLLLRAHRDRDWSCGSVAERIYLSEEVTAGLLTKLTSQGLIMADGLSSAPFRYKPAAPELARMVDQLAEVYAKYLVPVTDLVHNKRRRNIEGFADAFKLRKET